MCDSVGYPPASMPTRAVLCQRLAMIAMNQREVSWQQNDNVVSLSRGV